MDYINLENTSDNQLDGESWLEWYYQSLVRLFPAFADIDPQSWTCPACGARLVQVGAHVGIFSHGSVDTHAYIIPLCKACNARTDVLNVSSLIPKMMVPSDSAHLRDIVFPRLYAILMKLDTCGALDEWDGHVTP